MPMHPPFPSSRSCTSTHVCHLHAAHSVVAQHHRLRGGIQIRGQGRAPLLKLGQRVKLCRRRGGEEGRARECGAEGMQLYGIRGEGGGRAREAAAGEREEGRG